MAWGNTEVGASEFLHMVFKKLRTGLLPSAHLQRARNRDPSMQNSRLSFTGPVIEGANPANSTHPNHARVDTDLM